MKTCRLFSEQLHETSIVMDDNIISEPIVLSAGFNIAVQIFIFNDNNATGKLFFETAVIQSGSWHEIAATDLGGIDITPGNNLDAVYDFGCLGTGFFRIRYDRVSGSAIMDIDAIRKRIH